MNKLLICIVPLALSGCGVANQGLDVCKYAAQSRLTLRATIAATNAIIDDKTAHGKPVDKAFYTALQVATASLTALDLRCPDASTN